MVKFIVLWNTPDDPVAFERHYRDVHIPLARQLSGLRRYTIGRHATTIRSTTAMADRRRMRSSKRAFEA